MKRILMIAYHFPPLTGSSGIQRTLRFVQQLPRYGWEPIVLTADPRAYERTSSDLMQDIPQGTLVERAFALDTARHLAWRGRYLGWMARPDRWVSWRLNAVRLGMRLIRQHRPDIIWSTYPIATAHLIGEALHTRSRLPWVADFRDPMAQPGYPADAATYRRFVEIEAAAMRHASLNLFTTPGAARTYAARYPDAAPRIKVLENGYDEESFVSLSAPDPARPLNEGMITLLHSGIVYAEERDPTQLMAALQRLHRDGAIVPGVLKIRFRAPVQDALLHELAQRHDVTPYVEVLPAIGYRDALKEMLRADGLLVMQASNCNEQIPAKAYEYLRARRPILCLADPSGDTATMLQAAGVEQMARLDDAEDIARCLKHFLHDHARSASSLPSTRFVEMSSREHRTQTLAAWLDTLTSAASTSLPGYSR